MNAPTFYAFPLGPNSEITLEGYVIFRAVPFCSTGELPYRADEVPAGLEPVDGIVYMNRTLDEITRAETMASAEGKPITIRHPPKLINGGFVDTDSAQILTAGHLHNVCPGIGEKAGKLVADFMFTTKEGIAALKNMREISPGFAYEAIPEAPGHARMTNIVFNHVALVEEGRAGAELRLLDEKTVSTSEVKRMPKKPISRRTWLDKMFGKALDEAMPEDGEAGGVTDPADALVQVLAEAKAAREEMVTFKAALADIQKALATLLADEEAEKAQAAKVAQDKKAADDAAGADGACKDGMAMDGATIAAAEIVAPGVARDKNMVVNALGKVTSTTEGAELVAGLAGKALDAMNDAEKVMVLKSAAAVIAERRKAATAVIGRATDAGDTKPELLDTPEKHNAYWQKRKGA